MSARRAVVLLGLASLTVTARSASAATAPQSSGAQVVQAGATPADSTARRETARIAVWDMDVRSYEASALVVKYVEQFAGKSKGFMEDRLARGSRYESLIRQHLRAGGLPEDLYYLAFIESGFDPNAYSRAAAVGMWQFMTTTARGMGLRVDWWLDERRDPVRSTVAAVGFLRGLTDQFGSLYLATAAYNGGPGRITRGLGRYASLFEDTAGDDLFFALVEKNAFRPETREYVPKLIAAALVGREPERYGLTIERRSALVYDSVRVGPFTTLVSVASAAGTTIEQIRELNPQILRGMTPPRDSVLLRIPAGAGASFAVGFAALDPAMREGATEIITAAGESIAAIARRHHLTTAQLNQYNPKAKRLKNGNLVAGQTIVVPTPVATSAATSAPDPAIERYGGVIRGVPSHVVQPGEVLGGIARKYGTTVKAIMQANGLRKDLIFAGQRLALPGGR